MNARDRDLVKKLHPNLDDMALSRIEEHAAVVANHCRDVARTLPEADYDVYVLGCLFASYMFAQMNENFPEQEASVISQKLRNQVATVMKHIVCGRLGK